MPEPLARRIDLVLLFDVTNGNPNGDPDAGNMPRMDPETGHGLVTDVCLKRKVRNHVEMTRGDAGHHIYVTEGAVLNDKHRQAYAAIRPDDPSVPKAAKLTPKGDDEARAIRDWMCANFWDIRAFGGVLSTGINAGQVRGPVQFAFGRSVEPVLPLEVSITRMAATSDKEKADRTKGEDGEDDAEKRGDKRTMGRKHVIPYGLYRAHGFVSAGLAARTGFAEADYALLLDALSSMFEHDRSAARGEMATRGLWAFEHDTALGRAPAHALFDRVKVRRKGSNGPVEIGDPLLDNQPPTRRFQDYDVAVDEAGLPEGVTVRRVV